MQAGADLVNLVKQYNEFKLRDKGVGLAVGLMFLTDIHSLTPDALAGTTFTDAWYWNFDAENRAFADRFSARTGGRGPRSPTRPTTPRRCSTWRPCRPPAPTTPTRSSSSWKARRSTTSSCATARSGPRTTASCTTRTSPR